MTKRRKVCVVLVDRANYGRLKPVMSAISSTPELELQVIAAGAMVLERFDYPVRTVRADGFPVDAEIYMELEGSKPITMSKSVGFGIVEFANELHRLKPEVVLLIGDRYEALAAAIAAGYMNTPIVHMQGGEVSGSIDESARHAITKFAQFHVPATKRSADYLIRMGEDPSTILCVGCPSSDLASQLDKTLRPEVLNARGNGVKIASDDPFLLCVFHPTTTEYGNEREQMQSVLEALDEVRIQTVLLWPNIDAGSDQISKTIRIFRDREERSWLRTVTNIAPEDYLRVLANTACAIGNSSSFVRDASFFGTPVVLAGNRQLGRETDQHVTPVAARKSDILRAIRAQLDHGRYAPSTLYGDGRVSERVSRALVGLRPYVQKRLAFITEG